MKIFHGTIEIAGQMGILCGELKRRGHIASGYNVFHSYLGYKEHLINTNFIELQQSCKHLINFYDLFHFHYNSSILPNLKDLAVIREKGKKVIMHHWGNDVRFHDKARVNNPHVYTGDSPPNEVMHRRLTQVSKYVDEAIVQDYEVYDYVEPYYKKVHVVPIAIDLKPFEPHLPSKDVKRPLVLHAPTNPAFKGTEAVEAAITDLQKTHDFEYRRIERLNHEQAIQLYRAADVIVDQLRCGSYGLLSVEAMALGKPVIAYLRDDVASKFPAELPIINANPYTVEAALRQVLEQPDLRVELGERGRAYAEKYHAKERVVDQLEEIYGNLNSSKRGGEEG